MGIEDRPERRSQEESPVEEDWEMSFTGTLTSAVDTLFTYKPILEALKDTQEDEMVEAYVRNWKVYLARHLEATAQQSAEWFLAGLKAFKAQQASAIAPVPGSEASPSQSLGPASEP